MGIAGSLGLLKTKSRPRFLPQPGPIGGHSVRAATPTGIAIPIASLQYPRLWGCNGNYRGLWRIETRVTPSVSFRIWAGKRAFCRDGSPSCAFLGSRGAVVLAMPWAASTTSMRNGYCQFWFEKQPEGRSPRGKRRSTCALTGASQPPRRWSVRANARRNSHCAPTFVLSRRPRSL
jgi:hypothetical protein